MISMRNLAETAALASAMLVASAVMVAAVFALCNLLDAVLR